MKKTFVCSLICNNGIVGGKICIEDKSIIYKTNKFTIDKNYKNIVLPIHEICDMGWKWIVFPIVTIKMLNNEQYKFIIFNKRLFNKCYSEIKKSLIIDKSNNI